MDAAKGRDVARGKRHLEMLLGASWVVRWRVMMPCGQRLSLQPCYVARRATSQDLVASLQAGAAILDSVSSRIIYDSRILTNR